MTALYRPGIIIIIICRGRIPNPRQIQPWRQHAYTCRARYCYVKSVRLSVRLSATLWYQNECTHCQILSTVLYGMTLVLRVLPPLQNSNENSLKRGR